MPAMLDELRDYGVNIEETMKRFMGNEAMYKKFLVKFVSDSNVAALSESLNNGDYTLAQSAAHTLKGVAGNLGLTPLYECFTNMHEHLRAGENAQAAELCGYARERYARYCALMKNYMD